MLLERGPLDLLPIDAFPAPAPPANFAGLAGAVVGDLRALDGALAAPPRPLSGPLAGAWPADSSHDLGTIAATLAGSAGGLDPAIGTIGGSADALAGEIAGRSGEVSSDLNQAPPPAPTIPPGVELPNELTPDPVANWDVVVRSRFDFFLQRAPSAEELLAMRAYYPDVPRLDAAVQAIAAGAPAPLPAAPPPPPPAAPAPGAWTFAQVLAHDWQFGSDGYDGPPWNRALARPQPHMLVDEPTYDSYNRAYRS